MTCMDSSKKRQNISTSLGHLRYFIIGCYSCLGVISANRLRRLSFWTNVAGGVLSIGLQLRQLAGGGFRAILRLQHVTFFRRVRSVNLFLQKHVWVTWPVFSWQYISRQCPLSSRVNQRPTLIERSCGRGLFNQVVLNMCVALHGGTRYARTCIALKTKSKK